ncbi:MAG: Mur ligase family protein, partial [Acidimicrobiales bacterium]
MRFSAAEVAAAVAGVLHGDDVEICGAAIDSRLVTGGELFVPVVADRDGHDFVATAVERGAAHLTARIVDDDSPRPVIAVADTATALLEVGRLARSRLPDRVVGITGSVGKTSTKDLLATVLARRFVTAASERSFNNELGVPLTLANAPEGTEAAVIEMGARGPGHIALLCDVARPTVGIVTAVVDAHLEMFGSLDGVARAKGELVEALTATGAVILNADDPLVAAMADRTSAAVLCFGESGGDVRAEAVTLDGELRATFTLATGGGRAPVTLAVRGRHQVAN